MSKCKAICEPCTPFDSCEPCLPCGPCIPFCNPMQKMCVPKTGPKMYTSADLSSMPQCRTICPQPPSGPRFVTVQQPPRTICRKDVIYCKRSVIDKHVVKGTKTVCEPKLVYTEKTICEPVVIWKKRVVPCPRILWHKKVVPDPKVVCTTRVISEPKEICRTLVCQPRPQIIQVPPPKEYCCYPTGANFVKPEPSFGNQFQSICPPCMPNNLCGSYTDQCDTYCGPC